MKRFNRFYSEKNKRRKSDIIIYGFGHSKNRNSKKRKLGRRKWLWKLHADYVSRFGISKPITYVYVPFYWPVNKF
jgi:hypothetical protein